MERSKDDRSRNMSGPCTYASGNTAENKHIRIYGILKREKRDNVIGAIRGMKIQVQKQRILAQRILCGHSREK